MLGIALGSFTEGFAQGVNLRTQLDEVRRQKKLREGVEGITAQGKEQYAADVKAGKAEPGDFATYYQNELVPQIAQEYLMANEPDKAQAWTDWAESASTKKAAKKFGEGLTKMQMGDVEGGVNDMKKAADASGYGPDGKMSVAEYYDEEAGAVTGYKLTFTQPDGKEHTKNVAIEDAPTFFANIMNPKAAFEMQQSSQAAEAKADLEVKTHIRKKQAEKELGVSPGAMTEAQYQNAIQEERKRIEDSALTSGSELSDDEKEAQAKDIVDKRLGLSAPPSGAAAEDQIAVDPTTGEQVTVPQTPAQDAAQPPAPAPTDEELGVPADQGVEQPVSAAPAATPAAATSQVATPDAQAQVARADQLMKQGGNAVEIAQALTSAGVPVQSWPQSIQLAARSAQLGIQR